MATVLVVDDESALRSIYRAVLERAGYTVLEAANGEEALAIALTHPVQVVVSDVVMPRMGGRELTWRLSESRPDIQVILISGLLGPDHLNDGVRAAAYLSKPVHPAEVVKTVASLLETSSL